MSDQFIAEINVEVKDSELDQLEQKLKIIENKKIKLDVEVDAKDQVTKLAKSIEKGLKDTKVNTPDIAKSLADSFNIDDKSIIRKMRSQINNMMSNLSSTWNGKDFDFSKASGFYSGMENLGKLITQNANIIESKTGIYDKFYDYAKNQKLFVSDDLKRALGGDEYKELLQNNVGKIVRDASKGISIDSIWGEMTSLFPEHFSDSITHSADQIRRYFDVLKSAREDITKIISAQDMNPEQLLGISDSAYNQVIEMASKMRSTLENNILSAADGEKTTFDLNVDINAEKIVSDIRNALSNATSSLDDALNINIKLNDDEIATQIRSAISKLDSGNEPVEVGIQINKEGLQTDITAALNEIDLPIHFNIDAAELEANIRQAVNNIEDIEIDLHINPDSLSTEVDNAVKGTDPLDCVRENAKNNPIEVGYKADSSSLANLANTADRVFDLFTGTNALDFSGDKIRETVSKLREMDTILTEISKVSDATDSELNQLGNDAFEIASKYGQVVTDYLTGVQEMNRSGYYGEQGIAMAELSILGQTAGDMSADVSNSYLLATDAAYQYQGSVEKLNAALDGQNMITNRNSVAMVDMAEATSKAASMAAQTGVEIDQLSAMIGTIESRTKSGGSEVGNAIKAILINLQNTSSDKIVDTLDAAGASMTEYVNGIEQLRNPIAILEDLAKTYNSLDEADPLKSEILTNIGGKYQANKLSALLVGWDDYKKMLSEYSSDEAVGSAMREAQKSAQSLNGELMSLGNAFTELVSKFAQTDTMKNTVNMLDGMVSACNNLQDAQLFIPTMISSIMGLRNAFTGKGLTDIGISEDGTGSLGKLDLQGSLFGIDFTEMGELKSHFSQAEAALEAWNQEVLSGNTNVKKFNNEFTQQNKSFRDYISGITDSTANLKDYKKYLKETGEYQEKFSFGSIKSVLANVATGFIAGAAIELGVAAITKTIDYIAHADDRVREAAENARSEWDSAKSDVEATNQQLETTQQRINELKAKGSLSIVEEKELATLQTQNAELERTLSLQRDIEKNKYNEAKNAAKDSLDAEKKYEFNTDENGFYTDVKRKVTTQEAVDKYISEIEKMQKEQAALKEEMYNLNPKDDNFEFDYENYQQQIKDYESAIGATKEKLSDAYNELSTDISLFYDESTGKIDTGMEDQVNAFLESQKKMDSILGNSAQSKESAINTLFAKKQFSGLEKSFTDAAKTGEDAIDSLVKETPGLSDALDKAGVSVDEFKKHFMALANPDALNFKEVRKQLKDAYSDILGDNPTPSDLKKSDYRNLEMDKFLKDKSDEEIEIFYKYVNDGDIDLSELTLEDIQELFIKVNTTEAEMSLDSLTESANTLVSSITSINSALASQTTGTSISTDIFEDESLKDYASALEYVNGCYQLNADKVKELTKAKVDEQIATNDAKKALEQQDYLKNAAEIDTLRAKLEAKNFAEGESAESIQAQINSLLESNSAIITNCNQLDVLNASLRESIGVYQQWKDAQSAGNSGDMFDDAGTAWSQIRDIADKDSDMYGRVGTVQYQAAVDFLVPENIDHSDQEAVQKYLDSVKKYMYFDDDGNVNGLNMDNFFQDAVKKGLMIETDDSYEIAGQMTMEKFAEGMGMSLPLVQAMFGEIEEFMPEGEKWFDWSDEAVQSLGDLAVVASDAADALQATDSFKDIDIKLDISDLETTEEKISSLDSTIAQMNQVKATPGVDTSQIEDANAIIQYCVQQKQALNEPAVMSVDTSMVEGQIGNAISILQQFQQAQNELEMQKSLGLDTSEAEGKVASLTSEIQGLKPNITAALNIDTSSAESIASSIASLTPEMMVTAGIDDTAIIGYTPEDKDAKVTYSVDHSAVDAYNPKDLSRKVTYTIVTEGSAPSGGTSSSSKSSSKKGSTKLNGTAHAGGNFKFQHAYGMALANGVWGAKQGGMTLVGELGREIIVDPITGKWHTVGDNGAEFTNIPKGAIVFNHLQSEELLKNGYVSSRAQAMVSGTAFVSGNAMVTGKVPKRVSATRNNNQKTTEAKSSNTSQNKNTTATNKNTKATEDNTKAQENLQDWIERQIDRLTRNLDSIRDRIDNLAISRNQNAEIDKFISQASQNIQTLNASADYYMQKANALGLDGSYISKIVQGTIQIEDIQDEDLRDKIQKYQDWYDKAVNLRDEIKSINKEINDMKISKLENIQNDYENLQKYHQSMVDINDAYSELSEKMNGVGNLAHLQNNLDQNKQMKAYYEAQAKEMQSMLDKLTAEGVIGLHSDTWLQWQTEINNVKKSIVECDEALIELKDSIRTVRLKQFSDMVEELEHASDILSSIRSLMSEEGIFDNDIKFTESGYAQLGIMAQELVNAKQLVANYNVAIEALNKDLKNGNITQNDYNQTLKEYEKSQMDAVKATKDAKEAILDVIRNGIEKQTEAMEKLIQKRKDDLSVQKEYYDFQKKMADQSKEMNKIRAQIAVLEGDDSLEAQSKVRKLQSQLQELQDQYNEDIKDHEYDVVQDAYDETLDKFKKNQEETLHELETNLDAQNKAIADTLSLVKDNYSSVYNELNTMATEYGFKLSEAVTQPWEDANAALNLYLDSINKLSGNVNIDTGKIQSNYTPVNTANKVGTEASTATSKNAGNWIKQGDRWWYQHTDGSYTKNGWEQIKGKWYKFDQEGWMQTGWQAWGTDSTGQTAWYYMNPDGSMATSQWIDDKYYVDSSGVMARNGYVKSKNGDTYYWVNNDGVWEPQWDTQNPDLDKYKVYYNRGTKSAKSGLAYLDDDENHRLDMGSEIIITEKGLLRQMDAGDMVFNKNQKKVLYDISNGELPYNWTSSILDLPEYSRQLSNMIQPKNIGGGDTVNYNMHYDTLMTVNGNVTNERFMKNICKESFDYTVSELKKYSKRI